MDSDQSIRRAEEEIDDAFASCALTRGGYAQAVWTLLSVNEDAYLKALHTLSEAELHVFADVRINALTYPLRVSDARHAVATRALRREYIADHYQLAWDWLISAEDYSQFCTIFPLWHRKRVDISISDNELVVSNRPNVDKRYEAYNRLVRKEARTEEPPVPPDERLLEFLISSTTIAADHFVVNFNPALAARLMEFLGPQMATSYTLPSDWQFATFSLRQYRKVLIALQSLLHGWHLVRLALADSGMPGMGYRSSVWVVTKDELLARLKRYSGTDASTVARILDLITFGSNNVRQPDIAIQPLLDLRNGSYALSPFVFLNINVERNLCVLLNQIPSEKERYAKLSNEKESLTKKEVIEFLTPYDLECKSGWVESTDLDLAIIDRLNKICLCLELKWFIEPAEIREVEQRTEELAQGITQAKRIKALFERDDRRLMAQVLQIDRSYVFLCAVASVNWIGSSDVQDSEIPIIKVWHLLRRLEETGSLSSVVSWLNNRQYLPVEGRDFTIEPWEISCGEWSATWYGVKPLAPDSHASGAVL